MKVGGVDIANLRPGAVRWLGEGEQIMDIPIEPGRGRLTYDKIRKTIVAQRPHDDVLLERALGILHRLATERTGWRAFFRRWYFSDEPLRNDAANLVREAGFGQPMPLDTRLVGDPDS